MVLFHNHLDDSFRFRYPLIQYKTLNGKAAIICIGDGAMEIEHFFTNSDFRIQIGNREESLSVDNLWAGQWLIQTWKDSFQYKTRRWLPFNKTNYETYRKSDGLVEQTQLLERILVGNLLSMGKGLNHHFNDELTCTITSIDNPRTYLFKGVLLQGFDITWKTNLFIPKYIGIGKGASFGFGTTTQNNHFNKSHDGNGQ